MLTDIRPLSKKVKDILVNSEIANVNKVYQWKIDAIHDCLLHDSKLQLTMKRTKPILDLVSEV